MGDVASSEDDGGVPANYREPSGQIEVEESSREQAQGLAKALSELDSRSRRIVRARWLTEGRPASLHDLGAEFQVSAERIRQVEARALERMREVMQKGEFHEYRPAQSRPAPYM